MAKIAVVGASGNIGARVVEEALSRHHVVTGIARNPEKIAVRENLHTVRADISVPAELAKHLRGADAVVVSVRWSDNAVQVIEAVRLSGVNRLIAVVGAGSLTTSSGALLIDTPDFPPAWRPGAEAAARALQTLKAEQSIDWLAFSPSAVIAPGQRTNKFRIGGDQLLTDSAGESRISREDFAVAIIDEIERPAHHRQRVTVGY